MVGNLQNPSKYTSLDRAVKTDCFTKYYFSEDWVSYIQSSVGEDNWNTEWVTLCKYMKDKQMKLFMDILINSYEAQNQCTKASILYANHSFQLYWKRLFYNE